MKHRNAIARDLRTPKYRPRVIRNQKIYSRKRQKEVEGRILIHSTEENETTAITFKLRSAQKIEPFIEHMKETMGAALIQVTVSQFDGTWKVIFQHPQAQVEETP
jgi:hypothetical protein